MNSFLSFSLFDENSEDYNIYRVSDGDRYNEMLSGEFDNIRIGVDGQIGEYDFGTSFRARIFSLQCFTDKIGEFDLLNLHNWLKPGKVGKLVFAETPYKYYIVKLESPAEFSFVPFFEEGENVYKGEIELELSAAYPYALSFFNSLETVNFSLPQHQGGRIFNIGKTEISNVSSGDTIFAYNGGNIISGAIIQITGTWNDLIVRNLTTKQEFSLSRQTQPNTTIEIDSTLGQVRLQTGGLAANIHKGDFIYIQEAGLVKKLGVGNFVKDSINATFSNRVPDNVEGKFIIANNGIGEVSYRTSNSSLTLREPWGVTGQSEAILANANKIEVLGTGINIPHFGIKYQYTYI